MKARSFVEGAGIAILLLLNLIWSLLSPHHLTVYHDVNSVSTIAAGGAIDLAFQGVLFPIVLVLLETLDPECRGYLWAILLAPCVAKAVDFTVFLLNGHYHANLPWTSADQLGLLCALVIAGLLLSSFSPRTFQKSARAVRFGLLLIGCCIFWMFPQLVYTAIRTRTPAVISFQKSVPQQVPSSPRVVWILLDELSYDQVFEHRQPSLKLPHFDQLRNESVVFSDVQPEGYFTDRIIPALFLGRRVNKIQSSLRRDLYIHDAETSRWERFDQNASLFGEAKRAGWTTGVAGWFNPYCYILKDVLDSCYWQPVSPFPRALPGTPTISDAMVLPFDETVLLLRGSAVQAELMAQAHAREYEDVHAAADALIRNESIRFVFLHLPVPHPPGICDRRTNTIGVRGTYLDNLALADRTLGDLLDEIQKTAAAPRTTLIVSSDHSWRVGIWRADSQWSEEEEQASGARFDDRPVLTIHFPGDSAGELRTKPLPELATTGMIEAILKNQLHSQSDLNHWLSEHHN